MIKAPKKRRATKVEDAAKEVAEPPKAEESPIEKVAEPPKAAAKESATPRASSGFFTAEEARVLVHIRNHPQGVHPLSVVHACALDRRQGLELLAALRGRNYIRLIPARSENRYFLTEAGAQEMGRQSV